ncbi:GCN5-related N-acetyltransferase protein [Rhizobium etli 8C-3]|uniref:GCN5-related N-acetyltransferase protein n=2 Tax=Rhizobium TaxID=379 RepID=A0A1L5P4K1_RHIET|nr:MULTISPECIES: GNAT family N-acetyltransferase [Rhizobium]APO75067.1 GCN5-related N-acetyltransferase protein [Rhizobium etli 8C-3]TCU25780.1 putative acetyltransferase [Rhizobium azibense]TCU39936.1 putative acetyltransferase [Rhizobium azibense]
MQTKLNVRQENPRQDDVASLLLLSDAVAASLYPGQYRRPLDPQTLSAPHISVFVARIANLTAVGCCALFDDHDGTAELKRMIVDQRFRQQGVGRALLQAAEAAAMSKGIRLIQMEVGIRNTDGQKLYRSAGYRERGPFGTYKPSPISLFFEKAIGEKS